MGQWWVCAKQDDGKSIRDAMDIMKCNPVWADDRGRDVVIEFFKGSQRWNPEVNGFAPVEAIMFDGGGCVRQNEPKVSWEANGCKMRTFVTHLPFLLDTFRKITEDPKLPGCVTFNGFARHYVLTLETVRDSLQNMESLLRGTESLRQELEIETQRIFNESPNVASVRKCGCMSGKAYGDCCGKHVETQEHRQRRGSIE